jgi:hypothetical protein
MGRHTINRDDLYQRGPEVRTLKGDTKKEYDLSPAKSIHVPEPAYNEEISTPRHCGGSSSSFRADVGLGASPREACIAMLSIDFCSGRCRVRAPRGRPTAAIDKSPCFGVRTFPILNDTELQMSRPASVRVRKYNKYY